MHSFDHPHPAQEDETQQDIPLHGYTYMQWAFGENRTLITRGQTHSYENLNSNADQTEEEKAQNIKYNNIYAMNQWKFTKSAWNNIDTEKTAVLSQELTDNINRVSKWALQSLLAGADNMKIVFVTRQKLSNNKKHAILGASTISTQKFIDLIGLKFDDAWSNVRYIVDFFERQADGEYLIIRDPIKGCLKIFRMEEQGDDNEGFDNQEE